MYNLLVSSGGWSGSRDSVAVGRVYVDQEWLVDGVPDFDKLRRYPAIFAPETDRWKGPQLAYVGEIINTKIQGKMVLVEYRYDSKVPPIPQEDLISLAPALDIDVLARRSAFGDLHHSAWYQKDADLYRVLLTEWRRPTRQPKVFQLDTPQRVNPDLLAVMMPFGGFDHVWAGIREAAALCGMNAERADNRWDHPAIIQDIVSLIDQGAIVVCDCTNKNPNVFYEMGIAHAIGKELITITQKSDDIPFDIGHLRYIRYQDNEQGIHKLTTDLVSRIAKIRGEVVD